ncbi:hypothetical protein PY650_14365 [Rhizobium calliandrae]|uniref:Uncharacterized protein n=1 Tax=Rhizobium calliandrae TaxID=1312182 RepID=A0ABT7KE50_9HYPH|nr:hypothetical protein [Rhizobium calliandrae]MDL2406822.1 hypothetical protein [Rhizobium calliandrae]
MFWTLVDQVTLVPDEAELAIVLGGDLADRSAQFISLEGQQKPLAGWKNYVRATFRASARNPNRWGERLSRRYIPEREIRLADKP